VIRVGPAGWSYADWEGRVYPRDKPRGFHPLAYLARYVDCIELNSSFYATPNPDHARRWVELVRDRPAFRFTAKLEQAFTHAPLPVQGDAELAERAAAWLAGVAPLVAADRLAAVLVQLPHSARWGDASRARLARIDALFGAAGLPFVLEVRHASWYAEAALAAIDALGWSLAEIDLPAAPDHPPKAPPQVGPLGYHRLHGRNAAAWFDKRAGRDDRYDYLYGPDELEELVRATRRLAAGRDETFVITNNHFSGKAVANALELLSALSGAAPLAPAELVRAFPRLGPIVRIEGQGTLF
jgi:uncharacterized protein YecE (DUF72 family)